MILSDGRTSRLYKKLLVEQQLVSDIGAFMAPGHRYPNLFIVSATPQAPHTTAEVEAAIYGELERLKTEPVSQRELEQILNKLEYEEARQMTSIGGLARNLTEFEAIAGTWRYLIEHRQQVAKVTPADIQRVAKKYLIRENRIVGFITPQEVAKQ
jgi:predicted Zn-dependent peptidase